jgi:single-strand DNA-binding protein
MREEEGMNSLNSILIEGNLVRDPETRTLSTGSQVCNFAVASNRFYKQNEELEKEVSYFDVEAWSRLGQSCATNLKKGRGVRVVGRLKQDRWTDGEGKTRSRVKIISLYLCIIFNSLYNIDLVIFSSYQVYYSNTICIGKSGNSSMIFLIMERVGFAFFSRRW